MEVEYGGIKATGGKLFIIMSLLGTLGGGLWGGFEFYKDYMDMKEVIANIDVDAIKAENKLLETKLDDAIEYIDVTDATLQQLSYDIVNFLNWVA